MKYTNKVLIICIYNSYSGLGHLRRMKSLQSSFKKKKCTADLLIINKKKDLNKINIDKYNKILIDINFRAKVFFNSLKKLGKSIFTFDYFYYDNQNINFSVFEQKKNLGGIRYSGFKFALISENFRRKKSSFKFQNKNIAIFGGDNFSLNQKSLKKLIKLDKFKLIFFSNKKMKSIKNVTQLKRIQLTKKFSEFIFCITNCGVSLLEALYMKKIAIVSPQTIFEKNFSQYLIKKNYVLGDFNKKYLPITEKKIRTIKKNISNLIDGKANERIVKIVLNYEI